MQRLIANAAPWPFELKKKYVERVNDYSLFEVYGSTELGVNTMLLPPDQMRKPGSCGRPIPGVEIKLFDDDGNEVTTPMEPGELYVLSDATFATYYKDPEKYDKGKRGDFMTVGDIAYMDDEGFYYICDRKSDMIISGGVNIYPAEIEAVLVAHPDIADAAVFGIPDDEWGEAVHAVITTYDGNDIDQPALEAFCREHLAGFKVPRVARAHVRDPAQRVREDPQARTARAVLGRSLLPRRLTTRVLTSGASHSGPKRWPAGSLM